MYNFWLNMFSRDKKMHGIHMPVGEMPMPTFNVKKIPHSLVN